MKNPGALNETKHSENKKKGVTTEVEDSRGRKTRRNLLETVEKKDKKCALEENKRLVQKV